MFLTMYSRTLVSLNTSAVYTYAYHQQPTWHLDRIPGMGREFVWLELKLRCGEVLLRAASVKFLWNWVLFCQRFMYGRPKS